MENFSIMLTFRHIIRTLQRPFVAAAREQLQLEKLDPSHSYVYAPCSPLSELSCRLLVVRDMTCLSEFAAL